MDVLLLSHRPMIRDKKWWLSLFLNDLNVSLVAAWHLHSGGGGLSHSFTDELDNLSFSTTSLEGIVVGSAVDIMANVPDSVRHGHDRVTCALGRCRLYQ